MVTLEEAHEKYQKHFNRGVPIFMELSDEEQEKAWFIEAILEAVRTNNPEINIEGHYDKSVIY